MKRVVLIALVFSFTLISCPRLPSLQQALRMADIQDFHAAVSICDQHLRIFPSDQSALRTRGLIHLMQGRCDLAEKDFSHSLDLNPKDKITLWNRGLTYHRLNKDAEAYDDLKTALDLGYDHGELRQRFTEICIRLKRFDEALIHAQAGIEFQPDLFVQHANLGMVLASLNRPDEALIAYSKAIELAPDKDSVYVLRGALYCREGRRSEARADFDTAKRIHAKWVFDKNCYCPEVETSP